MSESSWTSYFQKWSTRRVIVGAIGAVSIIIIMAVSQTPQRTDMRNTVSGVPNFFKKIGKSYNLTGSGQTSLVGADAFSSTGSESYGEYVQEHTGEGFDLTKVEKAYEKGPRRNRLYYVKSSKTGSQTFKHIFQSYGYRHNLNMILATTPGSQVSYKDLSPGKSWIVGPEPRPIHILAEHCRYTSEFQHKFFPDNETVFISSVREPVKFFKSYVDYQTYLYKGVSQREVLHNDNLFYKLRPDRDRTGITVAVRNTYLQWLGYDQSKFDDVQAMKDYIQWVDNKFDLILITDHFDESLVLLKRLMNWDIKDIFYGLSNAARRKSPVELNKAEVEKLLDVKHNYGDKLVFDYFNRTLWEKIGREREFTDELNEFRALNKQVLEFCGSEYQRKYHNGSQTIKTKWDGQMEVTDDNCLAMRISKGNARELTAVLNTYIRSGKFSNKRG